MKHLNVKRTAFIVSAVGMLAIAGVVTVVLASGVGRDPEETLSPEETTAAAEALPAPEQAEPEPVLLTMPSVAGLTWDQAEQALTEVGFTSFSADITDWEASRLLVTGQNVEAGRQIEQNTQLSFTCTRLVKVYIDVESDNNLLFATYDMDLYLDGTLLGTVSDGACFTSLTDTQEGRHEFMAVQSGNSSNSRTSSFTCSGDITFSCTIAHSSSGITLENIMTTDGTAGSCLTVPDVTGMDMDAALELLDETGFVNVSCEKIGNSFWNFSGWTVSAQSAEAGTQTDKNTSIVLTCEQDERPDDSSENSEDSWTSSGDSFQSDTDGTYRPPVGDGWSAGYEEDSGTDGEAEEGPQTDESTETEEQSPSDNGNGPYGPGGSEQTVPGGWMSDPYGQDSFSVYSE